MTNTNITAPTSSFMPKFGRSKAKVRERKVIWLILPTVVVLVTLFVGGFVFGILQSVGYFSVISDSEQKISFDAYLAAFQNETVRSGIILTFRVAILSTVLSTIIALAISLMISRTKRFQSVLISITQFNIPIPHVVAATGVLLTFSQSGIVSRLTNHFGITDGSSDFPIITNDPFGYGIIMSYLWKEVPFLCVLILSALRGPVTNLDETAKTWVLHMDLDSVKSFCPTYFHQYFQEQLLFLHSLLDLMRSLIYLASHTHPQFQSSPISYTRTET